MQRILRQSVLLVLLLLGLGHVLALGLFQDVVIAVFIIFLWEGAPEVLFGVALVFVDLVVDVGVVVVSIVGVEDVLWGLEFLVIRGGGGGFVV